MEPKPDTNTDFDYPPLTAEEFEQLFAFYRHDGEQMTASNGKGFTVSVDFPIEPAFVHKFAKGFRVKVSVDNPQKTKTFFPIANATDESALGLIKSFVERVAHTTF